MPAPANDNFASRQVLSGASGSYGPITIDDATTEGGEPTGSDLTNGLHQTVWFEWTAPVSGTATFDTSGGHATDGNGDSSGRLDTTMTAWTGASLAGLTEVASNDDVGGGNYSSIISFAAVSGTTYLIQVGTYDTPYTGTVVLAWSVPLPPVVPTNDSCENAEQLEGCGGTVSADNRAWAGTWPTGNDPLFNAVGDGGGAPLWWKWTNPYSRKMLFRVSPVSPADHSVFYNAGVAVGACGALDMTWTLDDVGHRTEGGMSGDDQNPAFASDFDVVVGPFETVYFEIDSYSGDTSEPPDASAHLGKFLFDWSALELSFYDTLTGADSTVASDLLASGFSPVAISDVFDIVRLGDRLYFIWDYNDTDGLTLSAGDCNLDGSGMNVVKVSDGSVAGTPYASRGGGKPQLMTDGVDVFVGYAYHVTGEQPNPDYNPSTGGHTVGSSFVFPCTELTTNQWHYRVHRFLSGAWPLLFDIGSDNGTVGGGFLWSSNRHDLGTEWFGAVMSASASQPGTVWIHASYGVVRTYESLHYNDYPLSGLHPGSLWCTEDLIDIEEYNDTYELSVAGASITKTSDAGTPIVVRRWDFDVPTIDPIFGPWQFFEDGPWLTDPSGDFPMIGYLSMWLVNDDGYPILAYNHRATLDSTDSTFDNQIDFKRIDTGAAVGAATYADVSGGHDTDLTAFIGTNAIRLSERFFNSETSRQERVLSAKWNTPGLTPGTRQWMNRLASDCSDTPIYMVPGDGFLSSVEGTAESVFRDGVRSWWSFPISDFGAIDYYDRLCFNEWSSGYDEFHGPDGIGGFYQLDQKVYYDAADSAFYLVNAFNQLRKLSILRNWFICEVGEPCVVGGGVLVKELGWKVVIG